MSCNDFVMSIRSSMVSFDFLLVSMLMGVGLEIVQWEVQLGLHLHGSKLQKSEFINGCGALFVCSEISVLCIEWIDFWDWLRTSSNHNFSVVVECSGGGGGSGFMGIRITCVFHSLSVSESL